MLQGDIICALSLSSIYFTHFFVVVVVVLLLLLLIVVVVVVLVLVVLIVVVVVLFLLSLLFISHAPACMCVYIIHNCAFSVPLQLE